MPDHGGPGLSIAVRVNEEGLQSLTVDFSLSTPASKNDTTALVTGDLGGLAALGMAVLGYGPTLEAIEVKPRPASRRQRVPLYRYGELLSAKLWPKYPNGCWGIQPGAIVAV